MGESYELKENKHGHKTLIIYSDCDYTEGGRKLLKIIDNGNGFTVKDYSWSAAIPDMYYNLDYATAELLYNNLGILIHGEGNSE